MSTTTAKQPAKSAKPALRVGTFKRASADELRTGKVQLVKPWGRKSVAALKKALSVKTDR